MDKLTACYLALKKAHPTHRLLRFGIIDDGAGRVELSQEALDAFGIRGRHNIKDGHISDYIRALEDAQDGRGYMFPSPELARPVSIRHGSLQ